MPNRSNLCGIIYMYISSNEQMSMHLTSNNWIYKNMYAHTYITYVYFYT